MAKAPKAFQPVIATANVLRTGDVVFRTPAGDWTRDAALAQVAATTQDAEALEALATADSAANIVVDAALIPIVREADTIRPQSLRERIRAQGGPTMALPTSAPPSGG